MFHGSQWTFRSRPLIAELVIFCLKKLSSVMLMSVAHDLSEETVFRFVTVITMKDTLKLNKKYAKDVVFIFNSRVYRHISLKE